jgi:hypothetical protein
MQSSDPRDPNPGAVPQWQGERWADEHASENPTLPRLAPIQPHNGASAPSAVPSAGAIPPLPRYAPPPAGETLVGQPAPAAQPIPGRAAGTTTRGPNIAPIDFAAVSSGDWCVGGGSFMMLVGSFLPWISVTFTDANNHLQTQSQSGWDLSAFGRVTALLGLVAFALFVVRLLNLHLLIALPWSDRNIYMALGVEGVILGFLYLIDNAHNAIGVKSLSVFPAFGLVLTLLGAIAVTVGAYLLGRLPLAGR